MPAIQIRPWRRVITCALIAAGLLAGSYSTVTRAQAAATPRPAVTSFKASRQSLPPNGGAITLTATVKHAATCTFTAAPKVAGLPATMRCAAGRAAERVRLPAGSMAAKVTYTFAMTAKGAGGTAAARPVKVVVSDVWPPMVWTQRHLDTPGGRLVGLDCVTTTFCMATDLQADAVARFNGTSWSAPQPMPESWPGDRSLNDVSCASTTFCLAVDQRGATFTYNGRNWTRSPADAVPFISALSCPRPAFCTATQGGTVAFYNGKTWATPDQVAPLYNLTVSCLAPTFCMAVDQNGGAYTYNGATWSARTVFDPGALGTRVSCASTSLCVAVDTAGKATVYTGTWGTPAQLTSGAPIYWVGCPSAGLCLADGDGQFYAFDGTTWHATTYQADAAGLPNAISCTGAAFCVVLNGTNPTVAVLHGTTWRVSTPFVPHGEPLAISCPTTAFCATADDEDASFTYNGRSWSAPRTIGPALLGVNAISCVSATFCMAVDYGNSSRSGGVYTYDGRSWTTHSPLGIPLNSVSCASPAFCVAVGGTDFTMRAAVWNGMNWQTTTWTSTALAPMDYVSCASATFCAVLNENGDAATYNGGTWSALITIEVDTSGPSGVSCPTARFCTAIDYRGRVFTFNGATWTKTAMLGNNGGLTSVSCTARRFCAVSDGAGNLWTYNGRAWSAPHFVNSGTFDDNWLSAVSCAAPEFCVAVQRIGIAATGTA